MLGGKLALLAEDPPQARGRQRVGVARPPSTPEISCEAARGRPIHAVGVVVCGRVAGGGIGLGVRAGGLGVSAIADGHVRLSGGALDSGLSNTVGRDRVVDRALELREPGLGVGELRFERRPARGLGALRVVLELPPSQVRDLAERLSEALRPRLEVENLVHVVL